MGSRQLIGLQGASTNHWSIHLETNSKINV